MLFTSDADKFRSHQTDSTQWQSMQLQDSSKHQLAVSKLFVKYGDKKLETAKYVNKGGRPQRQ